MEEKRNLIQVVERAFDILELLSNGEPRRSIDIAETLGCSVQAANNLLRTLFVRGYVSQDDNRNYRLGPHCMMIGQAADRWQPLRNRAERPLSELVRKIPFEGFIGVIENDKLYCVTVQSSERTTAAFPQQLWLDELHSTACGRVLLAFLDPEMRRRLWARTTRRKITADTMVDPEVLEPLCEQAQRDGFAEVHDQSREGMSSLAVPLRDVSGAVFAAIGISAFNPEYRKLSREQKLAMLHETAAKITGEA